MFKHRNGFTGQIDGNFAIVSIGIFESFKYFFEITYLEIVLAKDLIEKIEDLELHAGDFIVFLCTVSFGLIYYRIHAGALPEFVFGRLGCCQSQDGTQHKKLHGAGSLGLQPRELCFDLVFNDNAKDSGGLVTDANGLGKCLFIRGLTLN